jgi:hypothetical protein
MTKTEITLCDVHESINELMKTMLLLQEKIFYKANAFYVTGNERHSEELYDWGKLIVDTASHVKTTYLDYIESETVRIRQAEKETLLALVSNLPKK